MGINNTPFGASGAFDSKEHERRIDNTCQVGIIIEARYSEKGCPSEPDQPNFTNEDCNGSFRGPLYRVQIGDHKRYWIPQLFLRCGNDQEYWAFEKGEQVVVLCPTGDPRQGFVIGALASNDFRPPTGIDDETVDSRPWRETVHRRRYKDGYFWQYDRKAHKETKTFPDGSSVIYEQIGGKTRLTVSCRGKITISSGEDILINAEQNVSISAKQDVSIKAKNVSVVGEENVSIFGEESVSLTSKNIFMNGKRLNI